jgi:dihydropteroate synthase
MLGDPSTMQDAPIYADVVEDVGAFLSERAAAAVEAGIPSQRIWIDPGIGFGKTLEHNLRLLSALDRLAQLGYPLMLGASRKSFIGQLSDDPVDERLAGGLAALEGLLRLPHSIIRTHDVRATRQYLLVRRSLASGEAESWPEGPRLHP